MKIYFSLRFHKLNFNDHAIGFENGGYYLFTPIFDIVFAIY